VGFQADKDTRVSTDLVALVKGMCQLLDVPIMGLNILGGRPYINLDGYYWRAKRDGLRNISVEVQREATPDDLRAKMTATVILAGGLMEGNRVFRATAWHSAETEKMGTMKTADLINMKCESKAVRRALRMATGIGSGFTTEEEAAEDEARRQDPHHALPRAGAIVGGSAWSPLASAVAGLEAQRRFWARAAEIYPAPQGAPYKVDKAAIHKALGIPEEDGALRTAIDAYKKETGVTEEQAWNDGLAYLEDKHIGVDRQNPLTPTVQGEAQVVEHPAAAAEHEPTTAQDVTCSEESE
jgi:hypothetical protein